MSHHWKQPVRATRYPLTAADVKSPIGRGNPTVPLRSGCQIACLFLFLFSRPVIGRVRPTPSVYTSVGSELRPESVAPSRPSPPLLPLTPTNTAKPTTSSWLLSPTASTAPSEPSDVDVKPFHPFTLPTQSVLDAVVPAGVTSAHLHRPASRVTNSSWTQ